MFQRAVAGKDYVEGKTDTVRDLNAYEVTFEQSLGRAIEKFKETKDPLDMKLAQKLSQGLRALHRSKLKPNPIYRDSKSRVGQDIIDGLIKHPGALNALSTGEASLNDIHQNGMEHYQSDASQKASLFMQPSQNIELPTAKMQSTLVQQPTHKL